VKKVVNKMLMKLPSDDNFINVDEIDPCKLSFIDHCLIFRLIKFAIPFFAYSPISPSARTNVASQPQPTTTTATTTATATTAKVKTNNREMLNVELFIFVDIFINNIESC